MKKDNYFNVKNIETYFNVILPDRLRMFIETEEYKEYNGLFVGGLPNVDSESSEKIYPVNFNDNALLAIMKEQHEVNDLVEMADSEEDVNARSILPLSCLEKKRSNLFLVARIDKKECSVYLFEDEAYYLCSDSFDDFLKSLFKKGDIPTEKKSWQILIQAQDLYKQRDYNGSLQLLTDYVAIGLARGQKNNFYKLLAQCYAETGKYNEAEINFKKASVELELVDLYLTKTREYDKAEKIIEGWLSKGESSIYELKRAAFLAAITGKEKEAIKLYQQFIEKVSGDILWCINEIPELTDLRDKSKRARWAGEYEELITATVRELSDINVNQTFVVSKILPFVKLPEFTVNEEILHARGLSHLLDGDEKLAIPFFEKIFKLTKEKSDNKKILMFQKDLKELATQSNYDIAKKGANSILKWFK